MNFFKLPHHFYLAALLLFTASCAQLSEPGAGNGHIETIIDTRSAQSDYKALLDFTRVFSGLTAEAQRAEVARLNLAPANPQSRLMLAMAYGLPNTATRDSIKALGLLDEITANTQLDEVSLALVTIMRDQLGELNKSTQKLREEQKRADAIQLKLDELQKKLDDLKNIEKTMVDRDQGVKK